MMSPARTCILPVQDLLGLGPEARINHPGRPEGNWRWRMTPGQFDALPQRRLRELTEANRRFMSMDATESIPIAYCIMGRRRDMIRPNDDRQKGHLPRERALSADAMLRWGPAAVRETALIDERGSDAFSSTKQMDAVVGSIVSLRDESQRRLRRGVPCPGSSRSRLGSEKHPDAAFPRGQRTSLSMDRPGPPVSAGIRRDTASNPTARRPGAGVCCGQRQGHRRGGCREAFRTRFHHKASRTRHGSVDLPLDHQKSQRTYLGRGKFQGGSGVHFRFPGCRRPGSDAS